MPTVDISEEQRSYLDRLRDQLEADHVDTYGHVRYRDAIQYLIDIAEGSVDAPAVGDTNDPSANPAGADDDARLSEMMQLLETHADKWEESSAEDARYKVELPDGGTEHVRTRDDVRAILFKHYR